MDSQPLMAGELPVYVVHWNAPEWVKSTTEAFLASTIPTRVTGSSTTGRQTCRWPSTRACASFRVAPTSVTRAVRTSVSPIGSRGTPISASSRCHDVQSRTGRVERLVGTAVDLGEYGVVAPRTGENVAGGPVLTAATGVAEVAWASGTCLLLRRGLIEAIGDFDEDFGSYGEDIDLCYRTRAAGWKVATVTGVRPRVRVRPTRGFGPRCT